MSSVLHSSVVNGAGFGLGAFAGGAVYVGISIFYLSDFDPKFAGAPKLALQLELGSAALLALIGALISMFAYLWWNRRARHRQPLHRRGVALTVVLLGAPYVPLLNWVSELTEKGLGPETVAGPIAVSLLLVAYPLTAAFLAAAFRTDRRNRS